MLPKCSKRACGAGLRARPEPFCALSRSLTDLGGAVGAGISPSFRCRSLRRWSRTSRCGRRTQLSAPVIGPVISDKQPYK